MILTALLLSLVATAAPQKYDAQLEDEISELSVASAYTGLKTAYDAGKSEATLYINSPGGEVFSMLEFIAKANDLKKYGMTITCYGDVIVASAASVIFEAVCDTRIVSPQTLVLFHEAAGMAGGKETQVEDHLILLKLIDKIMMQYVLPRLAITQEEYTKRVRGRDWWMIGEDVVAVHAADKVVEHKDFPTLVDAPAVKPAEKQFAQPFVPQTPLQEPIAAPPELPKSIAGNIKFWLSNLDLVKTAELVVPAILVIIGLIVGKSALAKRNKKKKVKAALARIKSKTKKK